jgi:hypothetical protein
MALAKLMSPACRGGSAVMTPLGDHVTAWSAPPVVIA